VKLSEWPGFNELRFDTDLKAFDSLMSLFFNSAERTRASGKKVVAKGPLSPVEPIYAIGALAYDPYTHEPIVHGAVNQKLKLTEKAIDAGLSSNSNPWTLIMVGAIVSGKNAVPVDAYSTTCRYGNDQLLDSWQIMARTTKAPLHFWEIPRFDTESEKWAIKYLVKELKQLFEWLTFQTGCKITDQKLIQSIKHSNLLKHDLMEITRMLQIAKVPISALEYYFLQAMISDYSQDPEKLHELYRTLIWELKERESKLLAAPGLVREKPLRLFFVGDEIQELKLWNSIEDYGGVLVGCDAHLSLYYEPIKEDGSAIENLARWIWRMPCNMPTDEMVKAIIPFIKQQKPDAIIISSVVGSRYTPEFESFTREIIKDELGLPVLSLETVLPLNNIGVIDCKIRDFIKTNTY